MPDFGGTNSKKSGPRFLTIALGALVLGAIAVSLDQPVAAQQVTAAITGRVADPSDAVIPGAKVTAKDVARGTV